jgi:flagellar biosynthesis component FlhA
MKREDAWAASGCFVFTIVIVFLMIIFITTTTIIIIMIMSLTQSYYVLLLCMEWVSHTCFIRDSEFLEQELRAVKG